MPDRADPTLAPLLQSFTPDPAAVDRIVEHALAPRKGSIPGARLLAAGVVLITGATTLFWISASHRPAAGILSNQGDVYLYRSSAGVSIRNGPEPRPATFQIIWRGD